MGFPTKFSVICLAAAIFFISGCQSVEEIKAPLLQCHRCYTSTCNKDQSFCNSTVDFIYNLREGLIQNKDEPCPEGASDLNNVTYKETCHIQGSYCGKRTFKVTAIDNVNKESTTTTPTGTGFGNTSTSFPILHPPHTPETHEYEFVLYSCTKPETDCKKASYSNSRFSLTIDTQTNKTMEYEAELSDEPTTNKTCAKCQQKLCNKPSNSHIHNPPNIVSATIKFDASIVNILSLIVSFLTIHYGCDAIN